jgi:hypothetical protein
VPLHTSLRYGPTDGPALTVRVPIDAEFAGLEALDEVGGAHCGLSSLRPIEAPWYAEVWGTSGEVHHPAGRNRFR